jgi:ribonuclease P protein component
MEENGAKLESHGACDYISPMAGNGDARFPSTMKLKRKREFIRVFREGIVWKGRCFSLHVLPRTGDVLPRTGDVLLRAGDGSLHPGDDEHEQARSVGTQMLGPRLGMVVTRKVGPAVQRNRIKRRIREAFRKTAGTLPAVDIVIRPDAAFREIPEERIVQALASAVGRALRATKERE